MFSNLDGLNQSQFSEKNHVKVGEFEQKSLCFTLYWEDEAHEASSKICKTTPHISPG